MLRKKLLCVEDDNINAFIMEKLLAEEFDFSVAINGEDCLKMISDDHFDVILLDINLGRGNRDGIQVLQQIRSTPGYNSIPIFAITSYALPGDEEKFLQTGFDSYFSKPVDKAKLISQIKRISNDRSQE